MIQMEAIVVTDTNNLGGSLVHCNIEGWTLMSSVQLRLVFINLKYLHTGSNVAPWLSRRTNLKQNIQN